MSLFLSEVVIWSRSFDEYVNFFSLTPSDLKRKILSVADGASSFNLEAKERGYDILSLDPLYQFSPVDIKNQIIKSCNHIYPQIIKNKDDYIWTYFKSPSHLKLHRMNVMKNFLVDFIKKESKRRYVCGEIQNLPFFKEYFDIALVSNFLFLYSEKLDFNFHVNSLSNLLQIANEVRVFPLRGNLHNSPEYAIPVINYFNKLGCLAEIKTVNYHFTKNSNEMLIIKKRGV
jgi:hypothetical protein